MTPMDEKATPLKLNEAGSSKADKKVHQEYSHKPSLDQEKVTPSEYTNETSIEYNKVTPLEVAHLDEVQIHEDTPKLDIEHVVLLKLNRLSRIRHTRYKVWVGGYNLIYLPLEDAQIYEYTLTLDTNKKAQAQQTGLVVVDKLSQDRYIEHYVDILEEALRPKDNGTIYT